MTNGPESAPRRSRRAADVPVDSPAGPRERESQQRARDREALRAYKALAETQDRRESGQDTRTAPPTRRQLRLQQQQQRAAAAPGPSGSASAASGSAASGSAASGNPSAQPASPDASATPLRRERRRAAEAPTVSQDSPGTQTGDTAPAGTASKVRAAEASVPASRRRVRETGGRPASGPEQPARPASRGEQPARPASRGEQPARPASAAGENADPNSDIEGMSVEQALAARQALEGQARNHVAAMEALAADDPHAVDLELLAQQKALAERAKVLNRRTEAIRKLSQENEERKPSASDPTTAHNLAMVTPLEFVKVPGMEYPVMKAPPTSHVPIITSATPRVEAESPEARSMPVVPANAPAQKPAAAPRRAPSAPADVRHSRILARADALVNAPTEEAARPVGARSAFGLDPLDVMTAGLGRTRRLRFAVFGVAGLGTLALIVGVLMIVGGLGG